MIISKIKKIYDFYFFKPFIQKDSFFIDSLKNNPFQVASLLYSFKLSKNSVVFDIGGYKGLWSAVINKKYSPKIFIFEPVESFFNGLRNKFSKDSNITIYPFGLSGHKETSKISVNEESSSRYKKSSNTQEISIEDITDFIATHSIEKIDLVKINIEGDEYDLLNRLIETGDIDRCENILVQFHDFVDDAENKRTALIEHLKKTHTVSFSYPFIWELFKKKHE